MFVVREYVNKKQADAFLISFRLNLYKSAALQQVSWGKTKGKKIIVLARKKRTRRELR